MRLRNTSHDAWLTPVQHTHSPDTLPELGKKIASKANRQGVAERLAAPAVQQSLEVDLARIEHDDCLLSELEFTLVRTAKQHDATTFYRRPSVPGIGNILALVVL